MKVKSSSSVSKSKGSSRSHKKIDVSTLDSSFISLQQAKTPFKPVKKTKIIPVKPKVTIVSREVIDMASEDLSRTLQNF